MQIWRIFYLQPCEILICIVLSYPQSIYSNLNYLSNGPHNLINFKTLNKYKTHLMIKVMFGINKSLKSFQGN